MGLFDKIKKNKDRQSPQPVANSDQPKQADEQKTESFDFGGQELEIPKFPEPNIPEDKHEEQQAQVELPKPVAQIKKAVSRPAPRREVRMPEPVRMKQAPEEPRFPEPSFMRQDFSGEGSMMDADKPLFVKIEKYQEAMSTIKAVKEKLKDAQLVISKLERIKLEEDKEIQAWGRDIEAIKDKMINIDQILFEVNH